MNNPEQFGGLATDQPQVEQDSSQGWRELLQSERKYSRSLEESNQTLIEQVKALQDCNKALIELVKAQNQPLKEATRILINELSKLE